MGFKVLVIIKSTYNFSENKVGLVMF